ncbi:hypothetical protein L1887_46635 [Cichorium endivia]|nr:hypothetical protein L1887_46635 [Cichorium endivia]
MVRRENIFLLRLSIWLSGLAFPLTHALTRQGKIKRVLLFAGLQIFSSWEYVADHRGETVFSTETGEAVHVSAPGDYPDGTTKLAPATPYDVWNGSEWVTDNEAQHMADVEAAEQQKAALLAEAQTTISLWQTELQLGIISDEDKVTLINWLTYIKLLQAVETSTVPDISWPPAP